MSRTLPMKQCLSLLRSFDKDNPTPQQAIAKAAPLVDDIVGARTLADLNDGQYAALIDFTIWKGIDLLAGSVLAGWLQDGNLTLPPAELATYGARGVAEMQVWNIGNDG